MEARDKRRKNRIWSLILIVLICGIMGTTSTYAWFSVNRIVFIDTINVKVEAQGGLEISTDGSDWKTVITSTDITKAIETYPEAINQLPSTIEPVSTAGILNPTTGHINMYYGSAEDDGRNNFVLSAIKQTDENASGDASEGKYIAFDVYLKLISGAGDGDLYLTSESGATYEGEIPGIQNAIRYAFVVLGSTTADANLNTIQSLNGATQNDVYIWEPNYDVHNETAIANALNVYNIEVNAEGNEILDYDGIIANIPRNAGITIDRATEELYPGYFKKVNVAYKSPADNTQNINIFNISVGITKIRVYIWLEGQDVDCENYSAIGNINFKFQFTTNPS